MKKETPINKFMIYKGITTGHTLETAIADLVDNSIQYGGKYFRFGFYYDELNNDNSFAYFYDNGNGMTKKELGNAMTIGSNQNNKNKSLHSKFGVGLKSASLSNCSSFIVKTKSKNHNSCTQRMFKDENGHLYNYSHKIKIPSKLKKIFPNYNDKETGTLIIWENLDEDRFNQDSHYSFLSNVKLIQSHLMLTFHRFIESKDFSIIYNDIELGCINPSMPSPNTVAKKLQSIMVKDHEVKLSYIITPRTDEYNLSDENKKITKNFLSNTRLDGLLLYRNERLIEYGKWHNIIPTKQIHLSKTKRLRIVIEFSNELDKKFGLEQTKSRLKVPKELSSAIYNIYESMVKKIPSVKPIIKNSVIHFDDNLWKIKNNKPILNFNNKDVMKLIKNNKEGLDLLKKIEKTIPMIIKTDIKVSDFQKKFLKNDINITLFDKAKKMVEHLQETQDYDLKDCIGLICARRPFVFEKNLNKELKEYFL